MATPEALSTYLDEITGSTGAHILVKRPMSGLPVYLKQTYALRSGKVFGLDTLFALRDPGAGNATPTRLAADHQALSRAEPGTLLALVLDKLASHTRQRLVAAGIPFVVPGRQIFLPAMLIDLRERQPAPTNEQPESISWVAQVMLLRHLLHGDVEERNLAGVAEVCGYSPMAISTAQQQLVQVGLAEVHKTGRSKHVSFRESGRALWELALPLLRAPGRKQHAVCASVTPQPAWISGGDALARESLLAPGAVPAVAMSIGDVRAGLRSGSITASPDAEEADVVIEAWEYDPGRLTVGASVDPLSLFLCLRETTDERVRFALEQHMESITW